MEEVFKEVASYVALLVEAAAVLIIAYGALEALVRLCRPVFAGEQRAAGQGNRSGCDLLSGCCSASSLSWPQTLSGA